MFCPQCGREITGRTQICPACGNSTALPVSSSPIAEPSLFPGTIPSSGLSPQTSGKAIASLVLGLLSFIFLAAIPAIVFGHFALSDIKKSAGRLQGRGMALAGLVLGYLGIAFIPLVLIIAAIAIPNLLRARMAANEASAVRAMRTIRTAELAYADAHPATGFTCSLSDLNGAGLIEESLAKGNRNGYWLVLQSCDMGSSGPNKKYEIVAYPANWNQTGVRAFCSDESTVIRYDSRGSAVDCVKNGAPLE